MVATKDIESADDAHAWFVDNKVEGNELGWRMEVEHDGEWHFFRRQRGRPELLVPLVAARVRKMPQPDRRVGVHMRTFAVAWRTAVAEGGGGGI